MTDAPTPSDRLPPVDPRAGGVRASATRVFAICGAVSLVVAVAGLAHTLEQAAQFFVECFLGGAVGLATARWLVPISWHRRDWLSALVIAAAVTVSILGLMIVWLAVLDHRSTAPQLVLGAAPSVFATSLVLTALVMFIRPRDTATHAVPGAAPAKFLARMPAKLRGGELYAVEAEDHYLRLHTSLGQDLILMRLADAIAELEGIEGAQTHRSWWVAKSAVADVERGDGRATLTLKDGAEAPVSRGFARSLRTAGWF